MKYRDLIAGLLLLLSLGVYGQGKARISAQLSADSVLMGHHFELTYTLENAGNIQFQPPAIQGFDIISGPNTSSVMTMSGGSMNQRISYAYVLRPRGEGDYFIPAAQVEVDGELLRTEELHIIVLPNPEGIPPEEVQPGSPWGDMGMDLFQGFQMPDMRSFSFPGLPDSLNQFPDMEQFFKQLPDMGWPDFQLPQPDSLPAKKKRKIYKI